MTERESEKELERESERKNERDGEKKRIKDEKKERSRGVPLYVYPSVLSLLRRATWKSRQPPLRIIH